MDPRLRPNCRWGRDDDQVTGDSDWVPFGADPEQHRVLVDGVPPWLRMSLLRWVMQHFRHGWGTYSSKTLLDAARETRLSLRANPTSRYTQAKWVLEDMGKLPRPACCDWQIGYRHRAVDYRVLAIWNWTRSCKSLVKVAGWAPRRQVWLRSPVGRGRAGRSGGTDRTGWDTGKLLADAWQKVHRLEPDDSGAYADAVKAVEVASFDALGIDNSNGKATLGNSIRAIEQDTTWRLPFEREPKNHPTNSTVSACCGRCSGGIGIGMGATPTQVCPTRGRGGCEPGGDAGRLVHLRAQ